MRCFRITVLLLLLWTCTVYGLEEPEFSDDVYSIEHKNFWLPFSEIIVMNGALGAANYYIGDRTWAQIGTASIIENFEKGFDWDPDGDLFIII